VSDARPPIVNVDGVPAEGDPTDPPGYRARTVRIGPLLGAVGLGASIYELDPGESICPYHYEFGDEEWLLVLDGKPTVRTPEGEQVLAPGDVVCFRRGPDGAHKVTNNVAGETTRVLMISTMVEPSVAVYPDSGKVGVWPLGKLFREADAVEYYDGETPAGGEQSGGE
jgi:uncharacterized cupin superfamily protein